jgi:hypothetical protein
MVRRRNSWFKGYLAERRSMTKLFRRPVRRKTVHGVTIGIMMLDTSFERVAGDIGYAPTWSFPVHYRVVSGVTTAHVSNGDRHTLDLFLQAADDLVAFGVSGIATSCGFLALFHQELRAHCPVPIASSSLLQIPFVQSMLPVGRQVGVLTAEKEALTAAHFTAIGCPIDLPVVGMPPDGSFVTGLRNPGPEADIAGQRREAVQMAHDLVDQCPDLGAIVCECTNLAPHSAAMAAAVGLPVYDVVTMVNWLHAGIQPTRFID